MFLLSFTHTSTHTLLSPAGSQVMLRSRSDSRLDLPMTSSKQYPLVALYARLTSAFSDIFFLRGVGGGPSVSGLGGGYGWSFRATSRFGMYVHRMYPSVRQQPRQRSVDSAQGRPCQRASCLHQHHRKLSQRWHPCFADKVRTSSRLLFQRFFWFFQTGGCLQMLK